MKNVTITLLGSVVLAGVIFAGGTKIIETGNVGVKSTIGQIDREELKPGFHWAMPIVQKIEPVFTKTVMVNYTNVQKTDTKELIYEPSLEGEDTTGLEMAVDLIVEVDPQPSKMADMFIEVGRQGFEKKVLQPIRGVVRTVLGQYKADTIMSQRRQLENDISKALTVMFSKNPYYKLVNIQLKKIYLPKNVKAEIEKVQIAKQRAKAKQEEIKAAKAIAQSTIEKAKGDAQAIEERAKAKAKAITLEANAQAEANKKLAESITQELIKYKKVEAWQSGGAQVPKFLSGNSDKSNFLIELK